MGRGPIKNCIIVFFFLFVAAIFLGESTSAQNASERSARPTLQNSTQVFHKYENSDELEELVSFTVHAQDYIGRWPSMAPSHGTSMRASYRVRNVRDLEKYSIVQFIRGCFFKSSVQAGPILKQLVFSREFFGRSIPFIHPEWVIDSDTIDPMYWGNGPANTNRHSSYLWSRIPGTFNERTSTFYGTQRPRRPELYVTDLPSGGFLNAAGDAYNASMEFRTCIYHSTGVPIQTVPTDLNFAIPIHCVEWRNSHVYNFETRQFESPAQIDEFCLAPRP